MKKGSEISGALFRIRLTTASEYAMRKDLPEFKAKEFKGGIPKVFGMEESEDCKLLHISVCN